MPVLGPPPLSAPELALCLGPVLSANTLSKEAA